MPAMTTLLCVVGSNAQPAIGQASSSATNLTVEVPSTEQDDPVGRTSELAAAWKRAATHGSVFTAVPMDPLAVVVEQWALRLEGNSHELELSIGLVGEIPVPDFWIVADDLPAPHSHWYYEHLAHVARGRVLMRSITPGALRRTIGSLPSAPLPPKLPDLAASARTYVPSQGIGLPGAATQNDLSPVALAVTRS